MFQIAGSVGVRKFGLFGDRFHLPDASVVARNISLIIGGINNIWIERIRCDIAGLASANVVPIGTVNGAIVAPARNGNRSTILLRPVDAIRRGSVGGDVIELRRGLIV